MIQRYSVDRSTLRRWVRAGLPTVRRGRQGQRGPTFDAAVVEAWVQRYAGDDRALAEALCSRLDALSRTAARTLAQLAIDYLPIDEVTEVWNRMRDEVRARVARWEKEVCPEIMAVVAGGEAAIEKVLERSVRAMLTDLAGQGGSVKASTPKPRPIQKSRTVREARAQLAGLQTEILDVRDRIAAGKAYLAAGGRIV